MRNSHRTANTLGFLASTSWIRNRSIFMPPNLHTISRFQHMNAQQAIEMLDPGYGMWTGSSGLHFRMPWAVGLNGVDSNDRTSYSGRIFNGTARKRAMRFKYVICFEAMLFTRYPFASETMYHSCTICAVYSILNKFILDKHWLHALDTVKLHIGISL